MNLKHGINKTVSLLPGQFVRVTLSSGRQWTGSFLRVVKERGMRIAEFQTAMGVKRVGLLTPFYMRVLMVDT